MLFGAPLSVFAVISSRRPGSHTDDEDFVLLEHPGGVRSHLWISAVNALAGPRFRVSGLKAGFATDGVDPQEDSSGGAAAGRRGLRRRPHRRARRPRDRARPRSLRRLLRRRPGLGARRGARAVDPAGSVAVLDILEAARRSSETREAVRIEGGRREDQPRHLGPRPMITRFVPGGYQPEHGHETTAEKVRRAVAGLGDDMDGYEFHYPAEINEENLDDIFAALGTHDIYCVCTGLHLDPRFGRGALTNPDPGLRREAVDTVLRAADMAAHVGAHLICWPGRRGLQLPVPDPLRGQLALADRGHGSARGALRRAQRVAVPGAQELRAGDEGLHAQHRHGAAHHPLAAPRWARQRPGQHGLAAPADRTASTCRSTRRCWPPRGLLGHQHANSGWGTFDDDNMVGATAFMETLELALELRRAGYGIDGDPPAARLRPLPLHRGPDRRCAAVGPQLALHRRGRRGASTSPRCASARRPRDAVGAQQLVYAALGSTH